MKKQLSNLIKLILRPLFFTTAILLIASCTPPNEGAIEGFVKHIVRSNVFWKDKWESKSFIERIKPAPPELVEYLNSVNKTQGYPERPVSTEPVPELVQALEDVILKLPSPIKDLVNKRVIGVFTVNNLGGSGLVELTVPGQEKEDMQNGMIVLDISVILKRKANEWATWKENSAFKTMENDSVTLNMEIESEENNSIPNAFRYIFLHELGHILGAITNIHTSWSKPPSKKAKYPFTDLSWKLTDRNYFTSIFEDDFSERNKLRFYSFDKAKLDNSDILNTFNNLIKTNFVSLLAATKIWDDFAESFVTYFHIVLEKRPWKIIIKEDRQPDIIIESCWNENRCKAKKAFMENWFNNPLQTASLKE